MTNYADDWTFDNPNSRARHTKAVRGQTESFTFRMDSQSFRVLDEILQSGIDPRLKTKSDCAQDAITLFIEDWVVHYADGLSGRTLRILHLEREQDAIDEREKYLSKIDEQIENSKQYKDTEALSRHLQSLKNEYTDSEGFAPKSYLVELDTRIDHVRQLLDMGGLL